MLDLNSLELEYARKRKGKSTEQMADVIGKSVQSYCKKESGEVAFSDDEKVAVVTALDLSAEMFNIIFFDRKLPFW